MEFKMIFQTDKKIISPSNTIEYAEIFLRIIHCNRLVEIQNYNSLVIFGDVKDRVYFLRLVTDILYMVSEINSEINSDLLKANLVYTDITTNKEIEVDLLKIKNGESKGLFIPYENFEDELSKKMIENTKGTN